jgi:hypothetical protein
MLVWAETAPTLNPTQERIMSATVKASLVVYDIPENSGVENPSRRFRRIGVRVNLSVWVIPNHLIPYALLNTMAENKVTWHAVEFSTAESEKLIRIARQSLERDVRDAVARTQRSIAAAHQAFEQPEEGQEVSFDAFQDRIGRAVKRAQELLGDLEEAAKVFEIDPCSLPVSWAMGQFQVLQSAAHQRAQVYVGAAQKARAIGGDGVALANAAMADDVPAGVVADFLREQGDDETADSLQGAFAETEALVEAATPGTDGPTDDWDALPWE